MLSSRGGRCADPRPRAPHAHLGARAAARQPVRTDLLERLGLTNRPFTVAAVCVYHALVPTAVEALAGSGIPVAAVSAGFPSGQLPFETRLAEIGASLAAGAQEIDIVISRGLVLT